MKRFRITHRTTYAYSAPVALGPQRLMMRPRDSHDMNLDETTLVLEPPAANIRWLHDVWGNSVAVATFAGETDRLMVESRLVVNHYGLVAPDIVMDPSAEQWPFEYSAEELPDLRPYLERLYPGDAATPRWARQFVRDGDMLPTQSVLLDMMQGIRETIQYHRRDELGVQPPEQTLTTGGTCRDLAVLMMEALRTLGFATRFVSGYLYDPAADPSANGGEAHVGGGATHAWLDVYLPGAGWVEFDPTNALYGGADLIRIAVARDPSAAMPLTGSFSGPGGTTSTMTVEVTVDRID
ncbi:MAG: transglutaminase family protein [Geminicoccaceae bacterium]